VPEQPFLQWWWINDNSGEIMSRLAQHVYLTGLAVAIGLAIALPIGLLAHRKRWLYPPVTWVAGILYTIPSLAAIVLLLPLTGLSITTAEIALVSYTLLILIRNIVTGLDAVPDDARETARAMGYTRWQLLWGVELPLAIPAIVAGIRIATVTTIGLVTVASLIGYGGLGQFILEGLRELFFTPIVVGAVLSAVLAIVADLVLLTAEKLATPWRRRKA
jgi:osmoprotectant transport system permease protein